MYTERGRPTPPHMWQFPHYEGDDQMHRAAGCDMLNIMAFLYIGGGIKIKLEYFNKKTMVRVRKVFIS